MPLVAGSKDHEKLCDEIFAIHSSVRFAGVIDKMGNLVAGGMRKGIQPLEPREDRRRLYIELALRHAMRQDFDPEFGRTIYSLSVREKLKIASFPMGELLILISIDKKSPHSTIISRILKLIDSN